LKLLAKLAVAVAIGAACVYFVVRRMDAQAVWAAIRELPLDVLALYLIAFSVTLFFRAWRWEYLLRPIGVSLPMRDLLPISLAGFMAILALPVRLGELVRPFFVVRKGHSRMSSVIGTVAVERVVDGLIISIIFFLTYALSDPGRFPPGLRFAAWLSLLGFLGLLISLFFALRWPEATIRLGLAVTLLPRLSPRLAAKVADKLLAVIHGLGALRDARNMAVFLVQSVIYWGANGFGMWILARGMQLDVSPAAAFAAMSFTGVLISLPNAPGLVGQFHLGVVAALGAYLPAAIVDSRGVAFATVLHGTQFVWHLVTGFASLLILPGGLASLRRVVAASNAASASGVEAPALVETATADEPLVPPHPAAAPPGGTA
jgi:hypothetical protein